LARGVKASRYLRLLSQHYPSIQAASKAIIDLTAQLSLPKGTEHFVSDVHGEYEAFNHVLRSGSGSIRRRIDEIFGHTLTESERRNLVTLITYPEQKLPLILRTVDDEDAWYGDTLQKLLHVCRSVISKYPRDHVQAVLPHPSADIIEELLYAQEDVEDKRDYYRRIIETIIATDSGRAFVVALADLIQRLAIARLHVVGDIYDRGPGAHRIMDLLIDYQDVDVQWGNHDILWMGAAAGSEACIANVIRICLRYANMETLEHGYAISLLPLASFAVDVYGDDPCSRFVPRPAGDEDYPDDELRLMAQMHKAITIIQLKLEAQIIRRRPHYGMEDRLLLDRIDHEEGTVSVAGAVHPLLDVSFPTVNADEPYVLTAQEQSVIEKLILSFTGSKRLQEHVRFLFSKGSIYLVHNGNLLYHGCVPMNEDGTFRPFHVNGGTYSARRFLDRVDRLARQGYFATDDPSQKQYGMDAMWYLWQGSQSPLFGKDKMATFERYFIADPSTHEERRDPYYDLRERGDVARRILEAFGVDPDEGHIINGHVPVKVKQGESPIKASGCLIVIDGGFSKAYQGRTGIAGYTLVYNSWGLLLATHHALASTQKAIEDELDTDPQMEIVESNDIRIRVEDTDRGQDIRQRIEDLQALLAAYRTGLIKEE
jgi:fructose-1,6-bisphosphatase-3